MLRRCVTCVDMLRCHNVIATQIGDANRHACITVLGNIYSDKLQCQWNVIQLASRLFYAMALYISNVGVRNFQRLRRLFIK